MSESMLDSSPPLSNGQYTEPSELSAVSACFAKPVHSWHHNSFAHLDVLFLAGIVGLNQGIEALKKGGLIAIKYMQIMYMKSYTKTNRIKGNMHCYI
jgi:hypothetical protein